MGGGQVQRMSVVVHGNRRADGARHVGGDPRQEFLEQCGHGPALIRHGSLGAHAILLDVISTALALPRVLVLACHQNDDKNQVVERMTDGRK
ncbi:hypothetical protein Amsp01_044590 [Amycolatopsis sp. NBRC 101858]|nr:hypothetical protein Amsp01_044590 [Amycolatopsis sp. NBRC 101858]